MDEERKLIVSESDKQDNTAEAIRLHQMQVELAQQPLTIDVENRPSLSDQARAILNGLNPPKFKRDPSRLIPRLDKPKQ